MQNPVLILCAPISILAVASLTLYLRSRNATSQAGRRYERFGWFPGGAALGNALLQLQVFTQPHVKHVIVQMSDEEAAEEESGDPDDPVDPMVHLHRQAARIRRGEEIDRITAIVER